MAPLLVFSTVLVLLSMHLVVIDCKHTLCTALDCKHILCPSSCTCLGSLVDCSKRGLIDIPKDLPFWVQILDLQHNDISAIDDNSLEGLRNLTELDFSNNQLRHVNSSTIQQLTSLQKLKIHHNHLTDLPELGHHHFLTTLSLQHNEIYNLNTSIVENLPNLHTLDLGSNHLVDIPANTFGNSSSLLHLSLNHNRIVNLEKGVFDNLTALETLKLNKNKLAAIPKELFRHLGSLRHLELNYNNLREIEGLSFQGLVSLVVLKLRHSGITHLLDGAFYGLNAIRKLQLDHNNISKVTKGWLYGLNSLQRLYLNYNNISEIEDDAWDSGKRLLELDMSHNRLQSVTFRTFEKLYSLKRLFLSHNMITYLEEGAFRPLSSLQFLELRSNEVSWTIEDTGKVFAGLERLKYLGLSNNKIKSLVKRAFLGLSRLETLNLTHNELTSINENTFDALPQIQELLINSSSLLCDCKLSWLSLWLLNRGFQYSVTATCGFPERLQGQSIYSIPPQNFTCEGSPKPVIIKEPHTQIALKGENVTLECRATSSSSSHTKFHWRKDGKLLQEVRLWFSSIKQGNFTLHSSLLYINNIQDKDEGHYQCVISNHFGSVYSNKTHITVHVFPVFTKTPVDTTVKAGSTARLECGARGQPLPNISWQKDGGGDDFPAARERRMHVMPTDDVFFIVGVKANDMGIYSCKAENVAGVIIANATLTVLETPSFVKPMENKETRAGETAVLECMASGSPKPKLTWTKDGGPLIATERHFFTAGNQLLIIVQTQISDSGQYFCEMSNTLGTERGSSHLKILPAAQSGGNVDDDSTTTGVVIIAVVCCVVGTSLVWVVIIYQTRKRGEEYSPTNTDETTFTGELAPYNTYPTTCPEEMRQSVNHIYLDSHSGHSKDSGTGESGQPSSDDLLIEDDQGLLLDVHSHAKHNGGPRMDSLLGLQDSVGNSQNMGEPYVSNNSALSKEQVPLLHTFRTSRSPWKNHRTSIGGLCQPLDFDCCNHSVLSQNGGSRWPVVLVQRSFSAEHIRSSNDVLTNRGNSEPPQDSLSAESDGIERDSGFSTFPRSITPASVGNWSTGSPRLQRLPKDIPNDSGSFSIASEDVQPLSNTAKCHSITALPTHMLSSKSCTVTSEQK